LRKEEWWEIIEMTKENAEEDAQVGGKALRAEVGPVLQGLFCGGSDDALRSLNLI
jgi:hypothetical protein